MITAEAIAMQQPRSGGITQKIERGCVDAFVQEEYYKRLLELL